MAHILILIPWYFVHGSVMGGFIPPKTHDVSSVRPGIRQQLLQHMAPVLSMRIQAMEIRLGNSQRPRCSGGKSNIAMGNPLEVMGFNGI